MGLVCSTLVFVFIDTWYSPEQVVCVQLTLPVKQSKPIILDTYDVPTSSACAEDWYIFNKKCRDYANETLLKSSTFRSKNYSLRWVDLTTTRAPCNDIMSISLQRFTCVPNGQPEVRSLNNADHWKQQRPHLVSNVRGINTTNPKSIVQGKMHVTKLHIYYSWHIYSPVVVRQTKPVQLGRHSEVSSTPSPQKSPSAASDDVESSDTVVGCHGVWWFSHVLITVVIKQQSNEQ